MVLLEFSIFPTDLGESVGEHVARSLDIIDRSGIDYRLGPMGTCLEGEWDQVLGAVGRCFEEMRRSSRRISCFIKIDYREGRSGRLRSKVESVEKRLGRRLRT